MSTYTSPQVRFRCFNLYEARFPKLRVVSRETLHLIKTFREQGFTVVIEPDDGSKLNYYSEKGISEFLSDPIYALIVNTSLSLITNLISSWLYDNLKRPAKPEETNLVIELDENGKRLRYNHVGQPISDERFTALLSSLDERAKRFAESQNLKSLDRQHPIPIHLEHSGKVIGWAETLFTDDLGLRVKGIKVTDDETWNRIQAGELKGLSIGGIITSSICCICQKEYVDCNHIAGKFYDGKECVIRIDGFLIAEISIVREPVQPLAKIERA